MESLISALLTCSLFQGFSHAKLSQVLQSVPYRIQSFRKGDPVAIEGDPCPSIGIVTSGCAEIQRVYASGKTVTMDTLHIGNSFGEVILFSDVHGYPATIIAKQATAVIFLSKADVIELCRCDDIFLTNLLKQLSNRVLLLNQRLKSLSYQTIRQKIAGYLLDEVHRQGQYRLTLACSRREMAEQLGIPRPSLSRELAQMKIANLLEFQKNTIIITNPDALQDCLLE